jgi:HEAT repeats
VLVAFVVLAALALGAACRRTPSPPAIPPRPMLGEVSVVDSTARDEEGARLDEDALAAGLRARLVDTRLFETSSADAGAARGPTTRVRARVLTEGAEVGDKGVARARVHLWIESRPSDAPGALTEQLDGAGELLYAVASRGKGKSPAAFRADEDEARRARFEKLVLRVAGDLLSELAARRRFATATPQELIAAVRADGGELRGSAVRALGERHVAAGADVLLTLLDDPDEELRDAALGALISLGDRRAVTALTKSRSLRDRREMSKVIEAVSRLGGEEADDYLSFIASSHDDDEIRAEAAAARARMQGHAADARAPAAN